MEFQRIANLDMEISRLKRFPNDNVTKSAKIVINKQFGSFRLSSI